MSLTASRLPTFENGTTTSWIPLTTSIPVSAACTSIFGPGQFYAWDPTEAENQSATECFPYVVISSFLVSCTMLTNSYYSLLV